MFETITIYGAGAIGGWIAARLAASGRVPTLIARGQTLAAVQENGLQLHEKGRLQAFSLRATSRPADLGPQDLVIVAVKAVAMADVARHIAPLLGPDTVVLTAMNGVPWWFLQQGFGGAASGRPLHTVDPGGAIAGAIAAGHVMGCVVHVSCARDAPAVVRHNRGERIIIGEPAGRITPRAQALQALLQSAGFRAELTPHIQQEIWYKLWGNMTINPLSAITGATADRLLDDPLVRAFASRIMLEAREIGARIGIPMTESPEDRHAITRELGALKPSMLQDVEAGNPVEINALLAVVCELGQLTGVATPDTDTLLGLARVHARRLGLYGSD
ncbi:MAG: 2-dehydropantoate 2-reductase [Ottowia sp.]|nr:2-dehydropantoate 2-reductase [Ottowia sp.]